ncbi:HET-domain-containing protein [Chaetomidium leptoderma]|uniref:HET-domain-containing protein n=1 Tax=Chaetomidium leptoderma TaxID=669021 RepID=A0AAN6VGY0_9PEZI|nr:HET-domain-containing protein [Chaetomidium leptoderma]
MAGEKSGIYKALTDPYEIRVVELQPGVGDELLRCRLVHCSFIVFRAHCRYALSMQDLTKPVWYTALSYTWGPPVFEGRIECEGQLRPITRGLEMALRHFRQPDHSVVMWIDQLCINQDSIREKEQQIPLMSRIYQKAINTAMWLGAGTPESDSAMQLLEDVNELLQYVDSDLHAADFERMGLPSADSDAWGEMWHLLSRQWFTRVWIIEEVILSREPWVVCGQSLLFWERLVTACLNLTSCGITQWLRQRFGHASTTSNKTAGGHGQDVFETPVELGHIKVEFQACPAHPNLFALLVATRQAQCYDARDKIYGLLGVCHDEEREAINLSYADECTAASQYHAAAIHYMLNHPVININAVLTSVDHECSPDLPSWVPDWRKPRQTTALGYSSMLGGVYNACGWIKPGMTGPRKIAPRLSGKHNEELCLAGVVVDTLVETSDMFTNPELTYTNPTTENKTLLAAVEFISRTSKQITTTTITTSDNTVSTGIFTAFWQTLVAGKDSTEKQKAPPSYAEILSLLLDESTGHSPTLPGQTYSARQTRPRGKGRLELASLAGSRAAGRTFAAMRVAIKKAIQNRRLGVTAGGRLGLFPGHVQVGDGVCVLEACHVPFVGARGGGGGGRFQLVGECFVYGICLENETTWA